MLNIALKRRFLVSMFTEVKLTQWAHHGQMTFKQRHFNVYNVYTTLFQRRLTMMCPQGKILMTVASVMSKQTQQQK